MTTIDRDSETLPPPPSIPHFDTNPSPPPASEMAGRISHLERSIGELVDFERARQEADRRRDEVIGHIHHLLISLVEESHATHEDVRHLPCRKDGLGCIARKGLQVVPFNGGGGDHAP